MAVHPRVEQLRFARSEFARGLDGVGAEEARRRLLPMNSIGWMIGHMASQEYRYWIYRAQGSISRRTGNRQPPRRSIWSGTPGTPSSTWSIPTSTP
jgi:hypothetical protein